MEGGEENWFKNIIKMAHPFIERCLQICAVCTDVWKAPSYKLQITLLQNNELQCYNHLECSICKQICTMMI